MQISLSKSQLTDIEMASRIRMSTSAKDQYNTLFITTYNDQHWAIKKAVQKHWPILGQDKALGKVLPNKPRVVFRRANNVKSLIAPCRLKDKQNLKMQSIPQFFYIIGCYKCKSTKCKACRFISHGQKSFNSKDGHSFYIKQFCGTQFVVYGLRCPCGYLYVGRTVQAMRTRFGEHRRFIEKKIEKYSVPRHFKHKHEGSTEGLELYSIESIPMSIPEGERFAHLCKRESFWIFTLNSMTPEGLNEEHLYEITQFYFLILKLYISIFYFLFFTYMLNLIPIFFFLI